MSHKPPRNDEERLQNLIEALAEPGDDDDAFAEEMRAELAKRGLTLETWAEEIRARAQAALERNRRARRLRAVRVGVALVAGLVAATGGVLALRAMHGLKGRPAVEVIQSMPPRTLPDAGRK
jgi:alkylation response protein AidB-like acyl-CoA dehydrogenase